MNYSDMFMELMSLGYTVNASETVALYEERRALIKGRDKRHFALLGDTNVGKSTVLNMMVEKNVAQVSMVPNTHDSIITTDIPGIACKCSEIAIELYENIQPGDPNCVLWELDGVLFLLSATSPLSARDITGLRACIAYGVPCTIALNKIELLSDEDQKDVVEYVKSQLAALFGTQELIIIQRDQPNMGKTLLQKLYNNESAKDLQEVLLCMSMATKIKNIINDRLQETRSQLSKTLQSRDHNQQAMRVEETKWQELEIEVKEKENQLSVSIRELLEKGKVRISKQLIESMNRSASKKDWWNKQLELEMAVELQKLSATINKKVSDQILKDREWLIQTVEKGFNIRLNPGAEYDETLFHSKTPDGAKNTDPNSMKRVAYAGLALSSVALAASLLYAPTTLIGGMTLFSLKAIAGGATVATGFWSVYETNKSNSSIMELEEEIRRYTMKCLNDNLEGLVQNIQYLYESLLIAVKDGELSANIRSTTGLDQEEEQLKRLFSHYEKLDDQCDHLLSEFMDDNE